jgi:hypothetical protein
MYINMYVILIRFGSGTLKTKCIVNVSKRIINMNHKKLFVMVNEQRLNKKLQM